MADMEQQTLQSTIHSLFSIIAAGFKAEVKQGMGIASPVPRLHCYKKVIMIGNITKLLNN
jgi:hypothetical protein